MFSLDTVSARVLSRTSEQFPTWLCGTCEDQHVSYSEQTLQCLNIRAFTFTIHYIKYLPFYLSSLLSIYKQLFLSMYILWLHHGKKLTKLEHQTSSPSISAQPKSSGKTFTKELKKYLVSSDIAHGDNDAVLYK